MEGDKRQLQRLRSDVALCLKYDIIRFSFLQDSNNDSKNNRNNKGNNKLHVSIYLMRKIVH